MPKETKIRTTRLYRSATFERNTLDTEARTVELSFSSEQGVERWFGTEVLDHKRGSVRLDRLREQGPLLMDHDPTRHIGTIVSASVRDRVGRAVVQLGRGPERDAIMQDIEDGIRKSVSVGYAIHRMQLEETSEAEGDVYRATDWEPYEVSLVSMPADTSVGVGREAREWRKGDEGEHDTITVIIPDKEDRQMGDKSKETPAATPASTPDPSPPAAGVRTPEHTPPVDADAVRKEELARIRVIEKTGQKWGQSDLAAKAIDEGWSLERFNKELLDALPGARDDSPSPGDLSDKDIGLTNEERNQFSFLKAIRAQAFGHKQPRFIEEAAFELEACRAAEAGYEGKRFGGIVIPTDMLAHERKDLVTDPNVRAEMTRLVMRHPAFQQRVMTEGVAGASLIAEELLGSSFIELLRNNMILNTLGITVLDGLQGDIAIPRQNGAGTAFWLATDETDITESTPTLDQVTMTPKNVGALQIYTRQLMLQSSVSIEQLIRNDIAMILGLASDLAGLYGTGAAGQPLGIANTPGINSLSSPFAGPVPTYAEIVEFETVTAADNANLGNLAYLTDPTIRGGLKTTEKFTNTGFTVWEMGNMLNGYRAEVSTQVTAGDVFYGNWRELLQGIWGGLEILADPYTLAARVNVRLIGIWTTDFALRHLESFCFDNDTP